MSKETGQRLALPHVAGRVFDTPLLIERSKLVTILDALGPRLGFDAPGIQVETQPFAYSDPQRHLDMLVKVQKVDHRKEGYYVADGIAVIPIIGTLVQRSDWMAAMSGMIGYGQIERMFAAALDDPEAREIVLEIDSPGGEVAGAFDLADRMVDARGKKPITAVASEFAASAAYLIASAADEIVLPRTGYVGSIGVVGTHIDYSKALEKRGVAVTFVYAGAKKVDGNPYEPLPDYVKAEWQDEIERVYRLFVHTVARNRDMSEEDVRDTEAGMFMGAKAVGAGLANRVNSFTNELGNAVLRAKGAAPRFIQSPEKESSMKTEAEIRAEEQVKAKAEQEAKAKAEADAKAKAEADARAKAEADEKAKQAASGQQDAVAAAVKAERDRGNAIRALPEAKGREALAQKCVDKGMSVEDAKDLLVTAPKTNAVHEAILQHGGAGVRADNETERPQPTLATHAEHYAFYNGQMAKGQGTRTGQ